MRDLYITTPIYYVNAEPHIGHAYSSIMADVLCRYHRQRSVRARFLTGTDEHGEKVEQSAARRQVTPQAFVDRVSGLFRDVLPLIYAQPDDFIRTTEERHKQVVSKVLVDLFEKGDIYKGEYHGLYCVGCERFLTEKELVGGNCPDHGVPPKEVVEENYLFKMEKYRDWLREHIEKNPDFISPDRYRSEVLAMLREPIGDLSISRPRSRLTWGIPLPFDQNHVLYVWIDALMNYVSALGGAGSPLFETHWQDAVHLIGKDILKPHGIFWPTVLKAAGLPIYQGLRVHGYWLVDASKMSKSIGNVVRPQGMVERFGADSLRYYLMRDMVFGSDADFSELGLATRRNSDLANDLGNLLSRVLTMIVRYCHGEIPSSGAPGPLEEGLRAMATTLPARADEAVSRLELHLAVEETLQMVRKANQYVQEAAPWAAIKQPDGEARVRTILWHAAEALRLAAVMLHPIMPVKMTELLRQLGVQNLEVNSGIEWTLAFGHLPAGLKVAPAEVLFPKIDLDSLKAQFEGDKGVAASEPQKPTRGKDASKPAHEEPTFQPIAITDFQKVELRVAEVLEVKPVPKTKKLLQLTLKVGQDVRTVLSGIAEHYSPEQLQGKKVILVANLEPATMRGIVSQGMILAAEDADGKLSIATLDRDLPSGSRVR